MSVTWNPSDKGVDVTLSGGDLTASISNAHAHAVRSTTSKSSGKWYFEVTLGANPTGIVGLANATANMSEAANNITISANAIGYFPGAGTIQQNNTTHQSGLATATTGDVIGVAYDQGAGTVKFYKNNVALGVADTHVPSGALFAVLGGYGFTFDSTTDFGATNFVYTPPSGFSAWDGSFTHAMTGGVTISSDTTFYPPPAVAMTGGVTIGSAFVVTIHTAFIHSMTGGVSVGGQSAYSASHPAIYNLADDLVPAGGMLMGGGALMQEAIQYVPSGGLLMGGSATVLERIPYAPSGGMRMSGTAPMSFVASFTPSGGMLMSGSATPTTKYAVSASGGMVMGGSAPVVVRQSLHAPSGGMVMGGGALMYMVPVGTVLTTENPYGDAFPGWSLNYDTNAATRYLGLAANSLAQFAGRTFVANAGGIYEIGADSDAGQPINASIEFPTTDFQTSRQKHMEVAYVGVKASSKMKLKVWVNGMTPCYYSIIPKPNASAGDKGTRVPLGKGLVGRYWGARLDNIAGGDFALESVEFTPLAGQRHGA